VASGSNFRAAVTTISSISLQRQRTVHTPIAVMPTCNESRNQPGTDGEFRHHQHVPVDASMEQREAEQCSTVPREDGHLHWLVLERWAEDWVYSSLCTGDQLVIRGERNSMVAPSSQPLSRLVK